MIGLVSNDLMFQSRISATAKQNGKSLVAVREVEQLTGRVDPNDPFELVLLDLAYRNLNLESAVVFLQEHLPECALLAYGPHVDEERLDLAKRLGVHRVLTRGQFDRDLGSILQST